MTDKIINTCVGMETSDNPENPYYSNNPYNKKELKNAKGKLEPLYKT